MAYAYVKEAKKFDKTRQKYGSRYKTYTRKNGKSYTRRIPNALQNSVGATKVFPGYPRDSAVECKIGYLRTRAKRGHVAMLLDEGTQARYRKVDVNKADDFENTARNLRMLNNNLIRSGKKKGTYRITEPGKAQVRPVRSTKPGKTIDAKKSARGFELNAKIMRGIQSKKARRLMRPGYTGSITPSPIQSTALSEIKSLSQEILPQELLNALKKAGDEVADPKYQAIMRKYARKYGGGRILQQMNSQYGIFSTRTK
jgi:ribosomal protein L13E